MTKISPKDFSEAGKQIIKAMKNGTEFVPLNKNELKIHIKSSREKLNMSIDQFARAFKFKPRLVEKWEIGSAFPKKDYEHAFLKIIFADPVYAYKVLNLNKS